MSSSRRNILIFDPERDMAELLTRAIETHLASKCYLATREEECLALLRDIPFALALLDCDAVSADDFKLLRKIRGEHPEVTLVIQSYLHQQESAQAAKQHGAVALLIKPLPIQSFRERLRAILDGTVQPCHSSGDSTVTD